MSKLPELQKPLKTRTIFGLNVLHTPEGHRVVILPTCTAPHEHLMPENWDSSRWGWARPVLRVSALKNKEPAFLFVKEPERVFSLGSRSIWTYIPPSARFKSGESKAVEAQADKEARMLLRLAAIGVKAEVPQAIVYYNDGRRAVITAGAKTVPRANGPGFAFGVELLGYRKAEADGFEIVDKRDTNLVFDHPQEPRIIDVNRWEHPTVKRYFRKLVAAIRKKVEEQAATAKK